VKGLILASPHDRNGNLKEKLDYLDIQNLENGTVYVQVARALPCSIQRIMFCFWQAAVVYYFTRILSCFSEQEVFSFVCSTMTAVCACYL